MTNMAADFTDDKFVQEDENDFDIIIVGAGLTGLTCAYNILRRKAGLEVLIIEANKEVGGRILSKGCNETFHANPAQNHITDLIKTLHVKTRRQKNDIKPGVLYTKYGPTQTLPTLYGAEVHNFLQAMETDALDPRFSTYTGHEDAKQLAETSVEHLLRQITFLPYARSLCRAFVCSICATRNLKNVSSLWFFVLLNGAYGFFNRLKIAINDSNQYFIKGGMTEIAQELLKKILQQRGKIRYVEPVNEIIFNDDRAYVLTDKVKLKCEYVVVAVPPPMQSRIVIKPSMECFLNAQTMYAPVENVFFNVTYKTADLIDDCVKDIMTTWDSTTNLNIAYDATHSETDDILLSGFLAESNATQTCKNDLFDTLNACFEITEAVKYKRYKECDAVRCNYFTSTGRAAAGFPMSVLKPTSIANHIHYIDAPYERIFFASSEYANNWPGTIDGAIEAGEITAYSILSRTRPQALTFHEINSTTSKRRMQRRAVSFKMCVIQYLGLALNIAVFTSFLRNAYAHT